MSRTIDDLRDTLASHVRELPPSSARTVAVQRRVRRIRRQRVAVGTTAAIAVAVVATLTVQATTRSSGQVASRSLAEYADGGRLIGSMTLSSTTPTVMSATVVPTSTTLIIGLARCTGPGASTGSLFVEYRVDGAEIGGSSCSSGSYSTTTPGISPGRPVVVQAVLTSQLGSDSVPISDAQWATYKGTRVDVGFYTLVPRSEYVFPPRPAHLESLGAFGNSGTVLTQQGSATRVTTVGVSGGLTLEIDAVEPGVVTAELNGRVVGTASTWTYGDDSISLDVSRHDLVAQGISGDTAKLTMHGSGFEDSTRAWQAVVGSPVLGGPAPQAVSP